MLRKSWYLKNNKNIIKSGLNSIFILFIKRIKMTICFLAYVEEIMLNLYGLLIGDKGYIRSQLKEDLVQRSLNLETPLRKNMVTIQPNFFNLR